MIEELFCLGARARPATEANALLDRSINHFVLGHRFEDLIERLVRCLLIDLLQPEIALQSLPADWPLLDTQRGVAVCKTRIIQIAILAQAFDNGLDDGFRRAPTFQQPLSQFFD